MNDISLGPTLQCGIPFSDASNLFDTTGNGQGFLGVLLGQNLYRQAIFDGSGSPQ